MNLYLHSFLFITISFLHSTKCSRVLELSDRFPEISKENGMWLVKFYAPWCGHCKRLEPIWKHVGQSLGKTDIIVGQVDVSRYPNVANEYKAYLTPTIKFIKGDFEHTYNGDRTKDAIVHYALRMSSNPVQEMKNIDNINQFKFDNKLFFTYVGERDGLLWDVYYSIASNLQPYAYFYSISEEAGKELLLDTLKSPTIFVHKEGDVYYFNANNNDFHNVEHLNSTLLKWINEERFEAFPKITNDNIKDLMETRKYLVLAIVEESRVKTIPEDMLKFRNELESLIRKKRHIYHPYFQFGWMGTPDIANSILMTRISLPYLLVINSTTFHHHLPEDDPSEMSIIAIEGFLEKIMNRTSPVYGGDAIHINAARKFFDMKRNLEDMWKGNPVLLVVVFTLPSLFFMLILWTCCCADILDADEDDEDELQHKKQE